MVVHKINGHNLPPCSFTAEPVVSIQKQIMDFRDYQVKPKREDISCRTVGCVSGGCQRYAREGDITAELMDIQA
jgi:hypothetical protein